MPAPIDVALATAVILLAALVSSVPLRRRSAASRHAVLAAGVCGALLVGPLAGMLPPRWYVDLARVSDQEAASVVTSVEQTSARPRPALAPAIEPAMNLGAMAAAIWAVGAAIGLLLMLFGMFRLVRLTARSQPIADGPWPRLAKQMAADQGLGRPVALLASPVRGGPVTWGVWRPVILLPPDARSWTEACAQMVLCHEMAHIRRNDWLLQLASELLRAMWWCNPLAWIACRRLGRESELACDDAVLTAGVPATEYAGTLVEIARAHARLARRPIAALPMARPSTLEGRITAMLIDRADRRPLTRRALAILLALTAAVTLPLASLRLAAQGEPRTLVVQIFDPTSSVLPGVEVTLDDGLGERRNALTDSSGRLAFDAVAPGDYTIDASLLGFRRLQAPFTLRVTRDWDRTITLQVGDLVETVSVGARRVPAASPSPADGTPREPLRVGGNIRVPRKLVHVNPAYPLAMREAGLEGSVPIEAVIGTDGSVSSVRVLSAQVHPEFAKAATDAVRQWKFSPTLLNGEAVEVRMTVTVRFDLLAE
jgi:TonB family protein